MPSFAPFSKVERTRRYGAEVILEGDTLDASAHRAKAVAEETGKTFISPYDDEAIIAGQGSIGLELMEDLPDAEAVLVPIGGGGVMAGTAIACQSLKPEVECYGVESDRYPSMSDALAGREPSFGETTIADGIAVKLPGKLTKPVVAERVREIFLCGEADFDGRSSSSPSSRRSSPRGRGRRGWPPSWPRANVFAGARLSPSSAAATLIAGCSPPCLPVASCKTTAFLHLGIRIVDRPGEMSRLTGIIAACGASILEIHHHRLFRDIPAKEAEVEATIETSNAEHGEEIRAKLEAGGYPTRILPVSSLSGSV